MDKSRSTKRTDTFNTIDKSRFNRIEKPTEIDIVKDNIYLYCLSLQGDDLSGITPDILCIYRKKERKKTPDTSIIRK